jgi:hypothetical protein
VAGIPGERYPLSATNAIPGGYEKFRIMGVHGGKFPRVAKHDHPAVSSNFRARVQHAAICGGLDRRTRMSPEVDAVVMFFSSAPEARGHHDFVRRPSPGTGASLEFLLLDDV